jgi:hypothetical protein
MRNTAAGDLCSISRSLSHIAHTILLGRRKGRVANNSMFCSSPITRDAHKHLASYLVDEGADEFAFDVSAVKFFDCLLPQALEYKPAGYAELLAEFKLDCRERHGAWTGLRQRTHARFARAGDRSPEILEGMGWSVAERRERL